LIHVNLQYEILIQEGDEGYVIHTSAISEKLVLAKGQTALYI